MHLKVCEKSVNFGEKIVHKPWDKKAIIMCMTVSMHVIVRTIQNFYFLNNNKFLQTSCGLQIRSRSPYPLPARGPEGWMNTDHHTYIHKAARVCQTGSSSPTWSKANWTALLYSKRMKAEFCNKENSPMSIVGDCFRLWIQRYKEVYLTPEIKMHTRQFILVTLHAHTNTIPQPPPNKTNNPHTHARMWHTPTMNAWLCQMIVPWGNHICKHST